MNSAGPSGVWAAIWEVAGRAGERPALRHACQACVAAVTASGAGVVLARDTGTGEPVFATDPVTDELEELQFTTGEGPAIDALNGHATVLASDLAGPASGRRWSAFAPAAVARGVHAVFAFPLQAGAIRAGVLDIYRRAAGPLDDGELATALLYADAALTLVLESGKPISRPMVGPPDAFDDRRAEVHQAAGMVSVQAGIRVEDALVRLRAYAYANGQRLAAVAKAVVERRLRFAPERPDDWPDKDAVPGREAE